jgi:Tfp pilus assembly protein PilF
VLLSGKVCGMLDACGGVFGVTRRLPAAVWAPLTVVLAIVLSLIGGLAVGVVPKSWGWAHNWGLLMGATGGLAVAAVLVAIAQTRATSGDGQESGPEVRVTKSRSSAVTGSNSGLMISADTVIVGTTGTDDLGKSLPALRLPALRLPGSDNSEWTGNNLPPRNPVFTGREEVLDEIGCRLADGPVAVITIRGLGGVGKSQVALEYAHRTLAAKMYGLAWWVRAESAVTIAEDLSRLAPLVGVAADGLAGEVAEAVLARLRSRPGWLVVFDNAVGPGDVTGVLPGGDGHVLITSRNRGWGGLATQMNVEVFERDESVSFLIERTGRDEAEAADALAAELGDLPLALAQAAAYIDTHDVTIGHYLALYRDPDVGRRLRAAGLDAGEYPASVAGTWLLHFERLRSDCPAAVDLLRLCAFLDPGDIDLGSFDIEAGNAGEMLAEAAAEPLTWTETTGALARTSLITRTRDQHLRVHRLVQSVTRDQLDHDQMNAWGGRVLGMLDTAFPDEPWLPASWPTCASLAAHIEAIGTYTESHPEQAGRYGTLLGRLGAYLAATAQYLAANATLERALAILEATYRADHPQIAAILANIGNIQGELGHFADARAILERALAIFEASYGPDHPEIATTLTNIGNIEQDLGQFADARATQERALAIFEAAYGPNRPEIAPALINLGNVQRRLGQFADARATQERVLAIYEAAHGPDHPDVAKPLANIGVIQAQLGEWTDARATLERALAIKEAVYGPDHPWTQQARKNLDG